MAGLPVVGQPAPPFDLPSVDGEDVTLSSYQGRQPVVLLFYPGDFTHVCTRQLCEFRDAFRELTRLEATVLAVSRDGLDQHARFRRAHKLPFKLLSDETGHVCRRYGALGLLGRAKRATFVIDKAGIVRFADVRFPLRRPRVSDVASVLSRLRREEEEAEAATSQGS